MTDATQYAADQAETFRQQLHELLRIPSISTDDAYRDEVRRAADWLVTHFQEMGLTAERIDTDRHPLVYAEWNGAGPQAKTVLVYGHYDVQPASKEDGWDTEPFEPVERDGRIYARGATDDKGQLFIQVKAVESLLKGEGELPVNVRFIIEGEEESGSTSITKFIDEQPEKLRADVCVISDTGMERMDQPVIVYALRGIAAFELTVRGPRTDLHSGMYGGTVHNPAQALAEILAALHDEEGRVSVPGFYDKVRELTDEERAQMAKLPWDNVNWAEETGAELPWGEADYSLRERVGARPTLEINGMAGGYAGSGLKAIIPASAVAKITCRLVADQDPDDIAEALERYIAEITPPTVTSELRYLAGAPAAQMDLDSPAMRAAVRAYREAWGSEPVFRREGGSIPVVTDLQNRLHMPVILMGYGLNSDGLHGPNEHFSIEMFHRGIETAIRFLREAARIGEGSAD